MVLATINKFYYSRIIETSETFVYAPMNKEKILMILKKFKKFKDSRGSLFFNFYKDFNFKIRRVYFIKNFNKFSRGNHARKFGKKLYICVDGKIEMSLLSKKIKKKIKLNTGDSLKVENYTWISIRGNKGSICLVLDSLDYKENHYIRNKKEFLNIINKK